MGQVKGSSFPPLPFGVKATRTPGGNRELADARQRAARLCLLPGLGASPAGFPEAQTAS